MTGSQLYNANTGQRIEARKIGRLSTYTSGDRLQNLMNVLPQFPNLAEAYNLGKQNPLGTGKRLVSLTQEDRDTTNVETILNTNPSLVNASPLVGEKQILGANFYLFSDLVWANMRGWFDGWQSGQMTWDDAVQRVSSMLSDKRTMEIANHILLSQVLTAPIYSKTMVGASRDIITNALDSNVVTTNLRFPITSPLRPPTNDNLQSLFYVRLMKVFTEILYGVKTVADWKVGTSTSGDALSTSQKKYLQDGVVASQYDKKEFDTMDWLVIMPLSASYKLQQEVSPLSTLAPASGSDKSYEVMKTVALQANFNLPLYPTANWGRSFMSNKFNSARMSWDGREQGFPIMFVEDKALKEVWSVINPMKVGKEYPAISKTAITVPTGKYPVILLRKDNCMASMMPNLDVNFKYQDNITGESWDVMRMVSVAGAMNVADEMVCMFV